MDQSPKNFVEFLKTQLLVELRSMDSCDKLGNIESLDLKIFIKGPSENPTNIKIILTSEEDLFFHYTHKNDVINFRDIQNKHKLLIKFKDYPKLLENFINNVKSVPNEYLALFYMDKQGYGRFDIIQNISHKFIELISCEFWVSTNEIIRKSIVDRFSHQKTALEKTEKEILFAENFLKHKAPGILVNIKKKSKKSLSETKLFS